MRILVAPLNWGLGHATRCIPIVKELEFAGFEPVIASDGEALKLLKKEFPHLIHLKLPSYKIRYTKKSRLLKWKLLAESFRIQKVIKAEQIQTEAIVREYEIQGIISDNRFGVRSNSLDKHVFITHQINVLSGRFTFLSSFLNRRYLKKFDQCWIPDMEGEDNLSGKLGHPRQLPENCKYIGVLSRLEKTESLKKYEYLILLSGPEPQRSILEKIMLKEFKNTTSEVIMVRGTFDGANLSVSNQNLRIENHLFGKALEKVMNEAEYIISRPGYTTLMDLAKLEKKAFFIPTPGQEEQNYLAQRSQDKKIAGFCQQKDFSLSQLQRIENYSGLQNLGFSNDFRNLFLFFKSE
ncbi:glycosyltransferase [Christiangramia aquimixticola]|uniref:glycosyltransferase n=1 Tax=Christiangramia aquimixticola TaxID=1697558 RepID=UPI003AA99787